MTLNNEILWIIYFVEFFSNRSTCISSLRIIFCVSWITMNDDNILIGNWQNIRVYIDFRGNLLELTIAVVNIGFCGDKISDK